MGKINLIGNYEEIQHLKSKSIGKMNYFRIMSPKLYPKDNLYTFKIFISALIVENKLDYINRNNQILVSYPFEYGKRKDYDEIITNFKDKIDNYNELFIIKTLRVNIFMIIKSFIVVFLKLFKYKELNLHSKIRIAAMEHFYEELGKKLDEMNFKEKILITFSDSYPEENLLSQYFKLISTNNKTFTLQHGQYRTLKKGYETTDAEAYMNFISDYIFAWGQKTKDEFKKAGIEENRVIVTGTLKNSAKYPILQDNNVKDFGVILNGNTYKESNFRMLELAEKIAKKYEIKYYIRMHPMNNENDYKKFIVSKNCKSVLKGAEALNYYNLVEFSILHMTGVFVELLDRVAPFFVYKDEWLEEIFDIKELSVSNFEDFNDKYLYFLENKLEILNLLKEKYQLFNFNGGNDIYLDILNKVLLGEKI